jgi:hypothetical protein
MGKVLALQILWYVVEIFGTEYLDHDHFVRKKKPKDE